MEPVYNVKWKSPSNIALIKYWGKHGVQLPNNASLSMALSQACTTTEMNVYPDSAGLKIKYMFDNERHGAFEQRIQFFFQKLSDEMPFLNEYAFEFESSNSFPHSAGIASSASSLAALALCLVSFENEIIKNVHIGDDFFQRASYIARLGSGSASRSVFGGWSTWGEISDHVNSSDLYASPLHFQVDPLFQKMGDAVLIVDTAPKKVSSSLGHSLMNVHPFANSRYTQALENLQALMVAMQVGDFDSFISIVENEALTLHALLMTSSPNGLLLKPETIRIIDAIRAFRDKSGTKICFTIDAGPNVHLLYPQSEKQKVVGFIKDELLMYCENAKWIDDAIGEGPLRAF